VGELVLSDAHWFAGVAQSIFNDDFVSSLAQNDTNGRLVIFMSERVIHGRKVEIHFPREFRLEIFDFELENHKAAQRQMVEKQIEVEVLLANLQMVLTANKTEPFPEFKN
jgi:hypothetical protein